LLGGWKILNMEIINTLEQRVLSLAPQDVVANYRWALSKQHPNSKEFPLMNPFHVLLIIIGYFVTLLLLKKFMKNRPRMELKALSFVHNSLLICLSLYMTYVPIREAIINNFSVFGNGVIEGPKGIPLANVLWIFYVSKTVEFMDSFIMVLKKNDHQLSFLHMYHHATIFAIWWAVVFYAPGGESYFSAAQNSFVHVTMYSYYLLASFSVEVPWKKYITIFQMFQFLLNMVQAVVDWWFPVPDGKYPVWLAKLLFWYMITLLFLFGNFLATGGGKTKQQRQREQAGQPTKNKKQQ